MGASSALIAILGRRLSTGFRALHYQVLALIALPCGIGLLWLSCALFDFHLRHRYILAIGSGVGILAGISIGYILDRFMRFVYRRFPLANTISSAGTAHCYRLNARNNPGHYGIDKR